MSNYVSRADLHMHTCHSDGAPTVKALLELNGIFLPPAMLWLVAKHAPGLFY
jgi:hypothetical protein